MLKFIQFILIWSVTCVVLQSGGTRVVDPNPGFLVLSGSSLMKFSGPQIVKPSKIKLFL